MRLVEITFDEVLALADLPHNPPSVRDQKEQNQFQREIKAAYCELVETLSEFGEEGDYYGVSDFAVRPDLRARRSVKPPPAHHSRAFIVTILNERFYNSDYLPAAHGFLSRSAPGYRLEITKDFDPSWHLTLYLTAASARICCSKPKEVSRLKAILGEL